MTRFQTHLASISAITFGMLAAVPAHAASLVKVNNWNGGISFPSDVSMYIYVPDNVAANPPVLTLIHYCGGSASAVFGQATTVINVANQNGVIVVAPDNTARCWDVQTTKGLTRDGGGDSHAIAQMVRYTITNYRANADRVYSTGDSSGGMMTQLLLALYPDIFKAGASFAGIPAGCRVGNETGNGYSGSCAGGSITKTAQQWGDIVRAMDPGYSGHRPRVQLFHGDQDQYINYAVHAEAIKEWANVLGLDPTTPTSTSTVTLGTHQASRKTWKNSCGYVVLDAFLSAGGDHGPSDALFNSYVPPFLGIDKTGAVDPEISQCGAGGASGTGGATSTGGTTSAGGAKSTGGASTAGTGGKSSGATGGNGGAKATGGMPAATGGATQGNGGGQATGGVIFAQTGGSPSVGGAFATGGNLPTGGRVAATGGSLGLGGSTGGAVALSTGGNSSITPLATGGLSANGGNGVGGNSAAVGGETDVSNTTPGTTGNTGSCSCAVVGGNNSPTGLLAVALGAVLVHLRRRKR